MLNKVDNQSNQKHRGQAMVEFALVFPLLLLLMLGIIEVGRILFSYSVTIAATREGARYGTATGTGVGGVPRHDDCDGIREAVKRIGRFAGIGDENIAIHYSNDQGVFSTSCPPDQSVSLGDRIMVTTNITISSAVSFVNFPPIPISSTSARTIIKEVEVGKSSSGAGPPMGASTDVNFRSTSQTAEETRGTIYAEIVLTEPQADPVSVPFTLSGTAESGSGKDYTITSSPVTIPAGQQVAAIYITLNNDGIPEGEETLVIDLGTPTNATLGSQTRHTVRIVDPPMVFFSLVSQAKSEDIGEVAVKVELSKTSSQDITVPYSTSGDAEWGVSKDYTTSPNLVVFPAGSLSKWIIVDINDDQIDEYDEKALLTLESPTNAVLGDPTTYTLTIEDNDLPPSVSFYTEAHVVSEEVLSFTTSVFLSSVSGKDITVPFSVEHITTTANDMTINTPSPLTVPAGSTTAAIQMDITEGDDIEPDESFNLNLGSPVDAVLGAISSQTITITESAGNLPVVSFSQYSQIASEGDFNLILIGVQLDHAWKDGVTVYYTVSGTATVGASADYVISASPLTITQGKPREEIKVQLNDDIIDEEDETIVITIDLVTNGTIGTPSVHTLTITDNDLPPSVSFHQASQTAKETLGTRTVQVDLSRLSANTVTVPLTISGTASQGPDYAVYATEIIFPPLSTSEAFTVDILDDNIYDPDETIILTMGTPTNATEGSIAEHILTIEDDELPYCETGTQLLTAGTDSITWSINNNGESLTFTGGSISWPGAEVGKPRLQTITFGGIEVFSGNVLPPSLSYSASETFPEVSTRNLAFQFSFPLERGEHTMTANFKNASRGNSCSITQTYNKP